MITDKEKQKAIFADLSNAIVEFTADTRIAEGEVLKFAQAVQTTTHDLESEHDGSMNSYLTIFGDGFSSTLDVSLPENLQKVENRLLCEGLGRDDDLRHFVYVVSELLDVAKSDEVGAIDAATANEYETIVAKKFGLEVSRYQRDSGMKKAIARLGYGARAGAN